MKKIINFALTVYKHLPAITVDRQDTVRVEFDWDEQRESGMYPSQVMEAIFKTATDELRKQMPEDETYTINYWDWLQ